MRVGAIILAAGQATRFGAAKQLLEIDGQTLIDRICRVADNAGCDPVLRVLGSRAAEILENPEIPGVETLVHEKWDAGMGSSLAAGTRRLMEIASGCDAVFILLADQPLVSAELLQRMRARWETGSPMILCDYGESTGPPALFDKRYFPQLMELQGDRGAKALAANDPGALSLIAFPDGAWDIDSPERWEKFLSRETNAANPNKPIQP